jgi:tetratricopeptide (TPR) repeat protein
VGGGDYIANDVAGRVTGSVLQARDISGGVHIHTSGAVLAHPPRQLPPVSAVFTDRTEDLAQLDGYLDDAERLDTGLLVVINGTAGVGKTSLAGAWLSAHEREFGDGHLYADLGGYSRIGPVSPGDTAAGFLRALNVAPERIPAELSERVALLRTLTFGRRVAVLLDNAVSAAQVRTLAVTSPGCVTVVTTRGALTGLAMDGARFHRLDPWRAEMAVRLMARMLGEQRIAAEPDQALEVARLCGGLPLAVGVATAKLVSRPRWPLARLAQTLAVDGRRLEVLSADEDRAVATALDGSYEALPEQGRRMYRVLGMCPVAWFDLDSAAAALGTDAAADVDKDVDKDADADAVEEEIDALVDAHLLEDLSGRYRFHDLVRLHAARCAQEHGDEEERRTALGRLFDFYLRATTGAEELVTPSHRIMERDYQFAEVGAVAHADETAALDWLDAQRQNLMAILRYCADQRLHRTVWQLADAMWPLFLRRRHAEDRLEAQTLALAATRADGNVRAEGNTLTSLAGTLATAGRLEESAEYSRQALDLYERAGDKRGMAQASNGLAKTYLELERPEHAEELFSRALELRAEIGYRRGVFLSCQGLGRVATALGRPDVAARRLRRAHRGLAALGDRDDAIWSLALWAQANAELGQVGRALRQLDRARLAMAATGSAFGEAGVHEIAARIHAGQGEVDAARECYAAALRLYTNVDPAAAALVKVQLDQLERVEREDQVEQVEQSERVERPNSS